MEVSLIVNKLPVELPELGGEESTTVAKLDIPSTSLSYFYRALDNKKGLVFLKGKVGRDVLPKLICSLDFLDKRKTDTPEVDKDRAIALSILIDLISWIELHPKGIFKIVKFSKKKVKIEV